MKNYLYIYLLTGLCLSLSSCADLKYEVLATKMSNVESSSNGELSELINSTENQLDALDTIITKEKEYAQAKGYIELDASGNIIKWKHSDAQTQEGKLAELNKRKLNKNTGLIYRRRLLNNWYGNTLWAAKKENKIEMTLRREARLKQLVAHRSLSNAEDDLKLNLTASFSKFKLDRELEAIGMLYSIFYTEAQANYEHREKADDYTVLSKREKKEIEAAKSECENVESGRGVLDVLLRPKDAGLYNFEDERAELTKSTVGYANAKANFITADLGSQKEAFKDSKQVLGDDLYAQFERGLEALENIKKNIFDGISANKPIDEISSVLNQLKEMGDYDSEYKDGYDELKLYYKKEFDPSTRKSYYEKIVDVKAGKLFPSARALDALRGYFTSQIDTYLQAAEKLKLIGVIANMLIKMNQLDPNHEDLKVILVRQEVVDLAKYTDVMNKFETLRSLINTIRLIDQFREVVEPFDEAYPVKENREGSEQADFDYFDAMFPQIRK